MTQYLVRRLLAMIPMFFLMTGVYFAVQNYLPGGPVQEMLSRIQMGGPGDGGSGRALEAEDIAKIKAELERQYGLDQPVPIRYWNWLKKIIVFDFGDSMTTREPAMKTVMERLPVSIGFGVPGFILTYLVCIIFGMIKALQDGSRLDVSSSVLLFVTYSIPPLVVSVVLLLVFCTDRVLPGGAWFPLGGARSDDFDGMTFAQQLMDYAQHLFLPVCASLLGGFTFLTLLMKNSLLDVLKSDFIRTARAKGLPESRVIFKHALRNAVLPLMVGLGGFLSAFVAGSIVIESVFGLPGMGRLMIESLNSRDYNVLMAVVVIQSGIVMLGQLISDLAYVWVDPRIDYES
jgi:microcin C transport system permease protein